VAFALDSCSREIMRSIAITKDIDAGLVGDLIMQIDEKRFCSYGRPSQTIECLTEKGSTYEFVETRSFAKEMGLNPINTAVKIP
jgi:putative transposase